MVGSFAGFTGSIRFPFPIQGQCQTFQKASALLLIVIHPNPVRFPIIQPYPAAGIQQADSSSPLSFSQLLIQFLQLRLRQTLAVIRHFYYQVPFPGINVYPDVPLMKRGRKSMYYGVLNQRLQQKAQKLYVLQPRLDFLMAADSVLKTGL